MPDAGQLGGVLERAIAAISEQAVPRLPRDVGIRDRSAIDQEDVDPAIVVVVEEQPARADRFNQVFVGARAVDVSEVDTGFAADVRELNRPSLRRVLPLAGDDAAAEEDPGRGDACDERADAAIHRAVP